jgi:hypothetical protein
MSAFGGKADIAIGGRYVCFDKAGISRVSSQYAVEQLPKLWREITRPSRSSRFKQQSKLQRLFVSALTLAEPLAWRLRSFLTAVRRERAVSDLVGETMELLAVFYFWLAFSIIVGVAANTRGRNALLWFFVAAVFTPLVAGCLVLAMPIVLRHPADRG